MNLKFFKSIHYPRFDLRWLVKILPDNILGREDEIKSHFIRLYGMKEYTVEIEALRYKNLKKYALVVILMVPAIVACALYNIVIEDDGITLKKNSIISIQRPLAERGGKRVYAEATIKNGKTSQTLPVALIINPEQVQLTEEEIILAYQNEKEQLKMDPEKIWEETLRNFRLSVKNINKDTAGSSVKLPSRLGSDTTVVWKLQEDSNYVAGLVLLIGILIYLYSRRHYLIRIESKKAKDSIIYDLPDFINKLMLMLNAGLVVHSAFIKTMDDYIENRNKNLAPDSYFYNQLYEIKIKISETNSPLVPELRDFAKRSGVPEFVRLSNIIADNIGLGAGLASKLSMEGEMMWFARKKKAVERGRLAETKMIFPLMLLLLSLVMVTTAPALMEI